MSSALWVIDYAARSKDYHFSRPGMQVREGKSFVGAGMCHSFVWGNLNLPPAGWRRAAAHLGAGGWLWVVYVSA